MIQSNIFLEFILYLCWNETKDIQFSIFTVNSFQDGEIFLNKFKFEEGELTEVKHYKRRSIKNSEDLKKYLVLLSVTGEIFIGTPSNYKLPYYSTRGINDEKSLKKIKVFKLAFHNNLLGYYDIHKYTEVDFISFQNLVAVFLSVDIHNKSINT